MIFSHMLASQGGSGTPMFWQLYFPLPNLRERFAVRHREVNSAYVLTVTVVTSNRKSSWLMGPLASRSSMRCAASCIASGKRFSSIPPPYGW
eukprot:scaffold2348_cov66-Phaeocystis_antarctica.AAC.9